VISARAINAIYPEDRPKNSKLFCPVARSRDAGQKTPANCGLGKCTGESSSNQDWKSNLSDENHEVYRDGVLMIMQLRDHQPDYERNCQRTKEKERRLRPLSSANQTHCEEERRTRHHGVEEIQASRRRAEERWPLGNRIATPRAIREECVPTDQQNSVYRSNDNSAEYIGGRSRIVFAATHTFAATVAIRSAARSSVSAFLQNANRVTVSPIFGFE